MVLRVEIEGRFWLVDVGMGGVGATAPIALDTEAEQSTPHELRRLLNKSGVTLHQMRSGADWLDVYEFTQAEPVPIDFELSNWYSCTHPCRRGGGKSRPGRRPSQPVPRSVRAKPERSRHIFNARTATPRRHCRAFRTRGSAE